jgi:hypothetical protein
MEIFVEKCRTATDYYGEIKKLLKQRLSGIYSGQEAVSADMGKKLAVLYGVGDLLPGDSLCLSGSVKACLDNLKTDLIRKQQNMSPADIPSMKILPSDKGVSAPSKERESQPQSLQEKTRAPAPTTEPQPVTQKPAEPHSTASPQHETAVTPAHGTNTRIAPPRTSEAPAPKPAATPGKRAQP